jgi:hypothetical protein
MSGSSRDWSWRWIAVASLLAALMLAGSVGWEGAVVVVGLAGAAIGGVRFYRRRNPPAVRCLRCGESLARTARDCPYCGSASWTVN